MLLTDYTLIKRADVTYVRLKAIIWRTCGIDATDNLTSSVGGVLKDILASVGPTTPLIINCSGVTTIDQQHGLTALSELTRRGLGTAAFLTDKRSFIDDLRDAMGKEKQCISIGDDQAVVYGAEIGANRLKSLVKHARDEERRTLHKCVADCFDKNRGNRLDRLHSTPLRSNGIFNARELISAPETFSLIAILLSEKLERIVQRSKLRNPAVLGASLRGSPIAAAVAFLSNPRIHLEIVDHIGPKQAVLEGYVPDIDRQQHAYIYVGDFVVGGAELKAAATYAFAHGSALSHALAIGSYLHPSDYRGGVEVDALVSLKECRKDLICKF